MERDLTFASGRVKMKEVILPNGTIQKVPFPAWRVKILEDPMGETAQHAVRNKDPDIKKVKVDEIPIDLFCTSGIADIQEGELKTLSPPLVMPTIISNLNPDAAKKLGLRPAEQGKAGR